jgi:hypothetical protein
VLSQDPRIVSGLILQSLKLVSCIAFLR